MTLSPEEWDVILLSLKVASWCVLVSLLPAMACAWVLARRNFPGKSLFNAFIHLPLVVPPVVIGYFLLVTLGRQGMVGAWLYDSFGITLIFTWKGAVIATAVMAFPLMVRSIRSAFENVDVGLEQAALTLGRSPLSVFMTITLPLISPGLISGATLGFARALGEFGATITFVSNIPGETRTLPIAIYSLLQIPGGQDQVIRLVIISVTLAFVTIAFSEWLARRTAKRILGTDHA
ncbi:MAG: molybdate ABC transporter permease subunit [Sneathiella sp.]|nr:molybdate ABC transporter permease subunit [Sneathiella sp.]